LRFTTGFFLFFKSLKS